ncbi:hypothetical protein IV203_031390 [Nitzschia inconspicua]|uniref:Uncharacterized protein n=1 Tax=Nitzschia inconspicua TaxID=303405 RepID=A0A9K3LV43_9STRA|nr:hypothetical protein IV203_031390 [Nitzschia inconspicua]
MGRPKGKKDSYQRNRSKKTRPSSGGNESNPENHLVDSEILPVNQVVLDAGEGRSNFFHGDDARQYTDHVMDVETSPDGIELKDPPPAALPEVECIEWEGGLETLPSVPDFDDDEEELYDEDDERSQASSTRGLPSMMKLVMQAILTRLQAEQSPKKRKDAPPPSLTTYLKLHGFWLRAELFPHWSQYIDTRNLGIVNPSSNYLRDVRVWIPEIEGGGPMYRPCCPRCKTNGSVTVQSYPTTHPGRMIKSFHTHYYLMSRQYRFSVCQKENERLKALNSSTKINFTFNGYSPKVMEMYPRKLRLKFPAVLTHRSGIDKHLARMMRPPVDNGSSLKARAHAESATNDNSSVEIGLGEREPNVGVSRGHQEGGDRPPAQEGNLVRHTNVVNSNLQATMLRDQMKMFATYNNCHLQVPHFPAAMLIPFPVNRKRPADALQNAFDGVTMAGMTGFSPYIHTEKKRTRGKGKGPRKPPTCVFCRNSPDPEVCNSANDCPGRWPRGRCPRKSPVK